MASTLAGSLALAAGLLAVPLLWDTFTAYQLGLFLLYGMAGQGIALCWGRAGFLPLGQALFFGMGAYLSGKALMAFPDNWLALVPLLLVACLVPALIAGLIGAIVFNRQIGSGPYFSLITLALAMLGFQLANSFEGITGGFNGMTGIPGLPGIDSYDHLYYVIVAALMATTLGLGYLFKTPFGQLLSAISQNEERLQFFGYRTSGLKALAFAVSAGAAGLAGALYAPHQGIVTPQAVGFLLSAELVIWTAVGGRTTLLGPVIGAVLIGFMASGLRDTFRYWEIVVALLFVLVVVRFPDGIAGLVRAFALRIAPGIGKRETLQRTEMLPPRAPAGKTQLVFDDVHVRIGTVRILNGLNLEIHSVGIHCIIGPNGAGKTSAFNVLTGKLRARQGTITWRGEAVTGLRPHQIARRGIGRKFQIPSVFAALPVDQNINVALWADRITFLQMFSMKPFRWRSAMLDRLEATFPFLAKGSIQAGALSLGQRQMLEFAMTNLPEPVLVLLDEPCAGLSTQETAQMIEAIAALSADAGTTTVIIEHDMRVVERLSNHVFVLHQGALLAEGSMKDIKSDEKVRAVYAGGTK